MFDEKKRIHNQENRFITDLINGIDVRCSLEKIDHNSQLFLRYYIVTNWITIGVAELINSIFYRLINLTKTAVQKVCEVIERFILLFKISQGSDEPEDYIDRFLPL